MPVIFDILTVAIVAVGMFSLGVLAGIALEFWLHR